ncbi:MAG: hypothetical protein L6264_06430 [Weeksellaceae bacterium]|nr:hypothetical protein [Bacteroidota bacterium]MCG2780566.1 hypothetical protein [Weeksellaceae bacterium]
MEDSRLQKYRYDDYTVVTNFETYQDITDYAAAHNGELMEVGFTDGSDNPMPNTTGNLIAEQKPFKVGLDPEYKVYYSSDEGFQEMAENILEEMKEKENDIAPEDWISDQNIATGDRIIIVKDGEVNTVTTRERIKFLMRGNLYELAVKVPEVLAD